MASETSTAQPTKDYKMRRKKESARVSALLRELRLNELGIEERLEHARALKANVSRLRVFRKMSQPSA
jgi:hypothetical protein